MSKSLPIKLGKEPLLDAMFEIRFSASQPASSIVLGMLYAQLPGQKTIEEFAVAQLPKAVRDADPNLQYAPVSSLSWDKYKINVSDRSVVISAQYPYPGWASYKPTIIKIVNFLATIDIIDSISRYSVRYVDLIPSESVEEQISMVNLSLTIANHKLEREQFQVRTEININDHIHVVEMIAGATAVLPNGSVRGVVVNVDSIANLESISFVQLLENFDSKLEEIHLENKTMFFDCLKSETITSLEPQYE